ncbi:MAG: hypothetical protein M2R45_03787 [Verrucomicrobia subdivision 3 bacterium]|nr:hypothetical protein [Limisphaerales bacterium]MCS1416772.1 hypothetical protein [Limisphaerales bacterium]
MLHHDAWVEYVDVATREQERSDDNGSRKDCLSLGVNLEMTAFPFLDRIKQTTGPKAKEADRRRAMLRYFTPIRSPSGAPKGMARLPMRTR